jgi:hypothetical protein
MGRFQNVNFLNLRLTQGLSVPETARAGDKTNARTPVQEPWINEKRRFQPVAGIVCDTSNGFINSIVTER